MLSDFKSYCDATQIKTEWYRHIDQSNGIRSSEVDWHIYGQLMFNKSTKIIQWRWSFQQMMLKQSDIYMENINLETLPHTVYI